MFFSWSLLDPFHQFHSPWVPPFSAGWRFCPSSGVVPSTSIPSHITTRPSPITPSSPILSRRIPSTPSHSLPPLPFLPNNGQKKKLQILMPTWRVNSFDKGYHFFLEFKFINLLVQEKKISLISYVFLIRGHFF